MAKNDQNESALPVPGQNNKITASDFLPKFFRTQANKKFLQGTLDQLIQPGVGKRLPASQCAWPYSRAST